MTQANTVRHSTKSVRRGFTLIEVVVTIGVIVLLVALLVTALGTFAGKAEETTTKNLMKTLDAANQEFEVEADRKITWGVDGVPAAASRYEMQANTKHFFTSNELTRRLRRSPEAGKVLALIPIRNSHTFRDGENAPAWAAAGAGFDPDPAVSTGSDITDDLADWDGEMTVLDAWERPLRIVHPGRPWNQDPPFNDPIQDRDDDGTLRTPLEKIYGICRDRRILIVSAGPDQRFGDHSGVEGTVAQAEDNLTNYVPGRFIP